MTVLVRHTRTLIRQMHVAMLRKALPLRLGVYLHELEGPLWPAFREMIHFLRGAGYRFVGPDAFLSAQDRVAFLSFDDNYRSFWTALPLLEELCVVATFYVNTCAFRDRTGQAEVDAYFDRLHFAGERMTLSVAELCEIAAAGHVLGAHGHSHRPLAALPAREAHDDIARSKDVLEEVLGQEVAHFSYPYGMRRHFNEDLRRFCRAIGFRTVANGIPAMQFAGHSADRIQRSLWRLNAPVGANLDNLRVDGRLFQTLSGRSAVG